MVFKLLSALSEEGGLLLSEKLYFETADRWSGELNTPEDSV